MPHLWRLARHICGARGAPQTTNVRGARKNGASLTSMTFFPGVGPTISRGAQNWTCATDYTTYSWRTPVQCTTESCVRPGGLPGGGTRLVRGAPFRGAPLTNWWLVAHITDVRHAYFVCGALF